jgi:hypothetical protein
MGVVGAAAMTREIPPSAYTQRVQLAPADVKGTEAAKMDSVHLVFRPEIVS